jgi:hypothetical protein
MFAHPPVVEIAERDLAGNVNQILIFRRARAAEDFVPIDLSKAPQVIVTE